MQRASVVAVALCAAVSMMSQNAQAQTSCLSGRGGASTATGAAVGGVAGAVIGAVTSKNKQRGAITGGIIGGVAGAAVGCWTANEQAVAAAREDDLNASAAQLERVANRLHAYNRELENKIVNLRAELASEQANEDRASEDVRRATENIYKEQQHARQQLLRVNDSLDHVTRRIYNLNTNDPNYYPIHDALLREQGELYAARATLTSIIDIQV